MIKIKLLAALLLSVPASADFVMETESSNSGYRGFGANETKTVRSVSGVKAREDLNTRFTGAVLGRLGGKKGKDAARILRVDLDKAWELDPKKKTYREMPIKLPPPEPEAEAAPDEKKGKREESKPTHRIKSAKADLKATGESKEINGFPAKKHEASLSIVVEEIETKKTGEYAMLSGIWMTPWTSELKQAGKEEEAFQKAYLAKLGLEISPKDASRFGMQTARMLLAAGGPELERELGKLAKKASKLDGYAVLTETEWRSPAPAAPKPSKGDDDEDDSVARDAAGAGSVGGAALGVLGGFAKRAAKKKAREAAAGDPSKPAFSVRTELKKLEVAELPSETFEVPKGYKLKE